MTFHDEENSKTNKNKKLQTFHKEVS